MSKHDQCPSTKASTPIPESAPDLPTAGGRKAWRSVEEFSGDPSFREFVEREFPKGASELLENSRRGFLKVMGAGLAIAGAATIPGCRRPERQILAYSRNVPEEIIPGKPLYYATAVQTPGGGAEGILVETHTGRPTKVEGNPKHPVSAGRTSEFAQASVLNVYDPDRLKTVSVLDGDSRRAATWDDFTRREQGLVGLRSRHDAERGRGLAFIVDKKTSPTRDAMKAAVLERWPQATWVAWAPTEDRSALLGASAAFGEPVRVRYAFDRVQTVLSLGSDFTHSGAGYTENARKFAATRRVHDAGEEMSRLYVAESRPTATGTLADHRFRMAPSRITALGLAVAHEIARATGDGALASAIEGVGGFDRGAADLEHAPAIAADMLAHRGRALMLAGPCQPAAVHALCHAVNGALGSHAELATTVPMGADEAQDSALAMTALTERMNAGEIATLVCVETNPLYDHPACCDFAGAFAKVATTITLSVPSTETAAASTWSLNGAHALESWSDAEADDGSLSVIQPTIAPLFDPAKNDVEFLALLAGVTGDAMSPDGYELVTMTWSRRLNMSAESDAFKKIMRRTMHEGVLAGSAYTGRGRAPDARAAAAGLASLRVSGAPAASALEVVYHTGRVHDGRFANNGWLQELPEIGSTVVWDNPVCLSPATARDLGLLPEGARDGNGYDPYTKQQMPQAKLATLTVDGREMEVAVWILPGMADGVAAVKLGYGRTVSGRVGTDVGHNTYRVRTAGLATVSGATISRATGTQTIASTQNHWSLEGRDSIVRAIDKTYFDKHAPEGPKVVKDKIYGEIIPGEKQVLNLAEQMGELAHTPANISIYENPQNESRTDAAPGSTFSKGPQWGMTIDANACNGCGVCTIACQSENNIPIVGKSEVAKGREMQWIRVDRYFTGEDLNNPDEILVQPMACVHCENAPCEVVCPVNATVHGPEGTNNMAYNRCIGTRYCANNCPYKVRRFNFFDWAQSKFNGGLDATYVTEEVAEAFDDSLGNDRTFNQNFIPPRLREKLDEISKMQMNPHVTVRSRGVMEKCSYCIQRVNLARHEVKLRDIWETADQTGPIPDGFVQTACQQACPSEAIVFGDILDPSSRVSELRDGPRGYAVLGYLNTRPRTSHMLRVRNPNPEVGIYDHHDPLDKHGGGHGSGDGGGGHAGDAHEDGGHAAAPGSAAGSPNFIDTVKRYTDEGYAMSLNVLGGTPA